MVIPTGGFPRATGKDLAQHPVHKVTSTGNKLGDDPALDKAEGRIGDQIEVMPGDEINVSGVPDKIVMQEIGWAVKQMWAGCCVRRRGWNGQNMWLAIQVPDQYSKMALPYVYMSTVNGALVPWLASQTDLLATDWEVVR